MTGGISDPFEGANRAVFAFNETADAIILKPIAQGYRFVVPSELRTGVRNALRNLKSPIYLGNELLQGDLKGAGNVVTRAAINSLIGVGGLFDVAGYEGIEFEEEDFGQTLAVWGIGHGPYLVAPLMGPGSFRDFSGRIVDAAMDPLQWWLTNTDQEEWLYARMGVEAISKREELLDVLAELKMGAIDYYATVRSVYVQNRASLVADKNTDDMFLQDIPDYDGQ
tara:strand:+ start:313281 stop:313952 length:672 start_codon:yes stop_codon:yes gene_type:complete